MSRHRTSRASTRQWAALAVALNELSRSMGTADPAPFAPRRPAIAKIAFAYECLTG